MSSNPTEVLTMAGVEVKGQKQRNTHQQGLRGNVHRVVAYRTGLGTTQRDPEQLPEPGIDNDISSAMG